MATATKGRREKREGRTIKSRMFQQVTYLANTTLHDGWSGHRFSDYEIAFLFCFHLEINMYFFFSLKCDSIEQKLSVLILLDSNYKENMVKSIEI